MINRAHPRHFTQELRSGAPWVGRIGGLRAKSHAELDASPEIDIGDITELAEDHAELLPWLSNLQLIGGCCGTDHRHIAAICARCFSGGPVSRARLLEIESSAGHQESPLWVISGSMRRVSDASALPQAADITRRSGGAETFQHCVARPHREEPRFMGLPISEVGAR
jgi:hypothetical protein